MPRFVNSDQRRELVGDAVMRLVAREGLPSASVRKVAAEAGISMGSLRHYFSSQEELLGYTMNRIHERARSRIAALELPPDDPIAAGMSMLVEVVPVDGIRMAEFEVWLALAVRSLASPSLAEIRDRADVAVEGLCRQVIVGLLETSEAETIAREAEKLHALVDGLSLHVAMGRSADASVVEVLRLHLDGLSTTA